MKDNNAEYHLKRPCVFVGSACDGVLLPGDRLLSVNSQSVEDISHREAQEIFKNGGVSAVVEVSRLEEPSTNMRGDDEETVNQAKQVLSKTLSGLLPSQDKASPSPGQSPALPQSKHLSGTDKAPLIQQTEQLASVSNNNHIHDQPYRTTPLILPNAKTIHDYPSAVVSGEHPPVPSLHPYRNSSLLLPEPRT